MLAHSHGQTLNASKLADSMGVSGHTIRKYIDLLEQTFVVRAAVSDAEVQPAMIVNAIKINKIVVLMISPPVCWEETTHHCDIHCRIQ